MVQDANGRVTIAVLKSEMRHLDERSRERHEELVRRFDRHEADHRAQSESFEKVCERVAEIEKWQEGQKERTGTLARISALMSAAVFGIGELIRWVASRGAG